MLSETAQRVIERRVSGGGVHALGNLLTSCYAMRYRNPQYDYGD